QLWLIGGRGGGSNAFGPGATPLPTSRQTTPQQLALPTPLGRRSRGVVARAPWGANPSMCRVRFKPPDRNDSRSAIPEEGAPCLASSAPSAAVTLGITAEFGPPEVLARPRAYQMMG